MSILFNSVTQAKTHSLLDPASSKVSINAYGPALYLRMLHAFRATYFFSPQNLFSKRLFKAFLFFVPPPIVQRLPPDQDHRLARRRGRRPAGHVPGLRAAPDAGGLRSLRARVPACHHPGHRQQADQHEDSARGWPGWAREPALRHRPRPHGHAAGPVRLLPGLAGRESGHRDADPLHRHRGRVWTGTGEAPEADLQDDLHVLQLDRAGQGAGTLFGKS